MTELVKKLESEAKMTEEMAEKAIDVVMDFVKDKLPDPIADQVVRFLKDKDASEVKDAVNNLLGGFGLK